MMGVKFLRPEITTIIQIGTEAWSQNVPSIQGRVEDLDFIMNCLNTNGIKFKPKNHVKTNENVKHNVKSITSEKNSENSHENTNNSVKTNENINGEEENDSEIFRKPSISQQKKKRGRKPKQKLSSDQESKGRSESNGDTSSLDDSISSTSSSRSRRAAAQAADQKMVQVQSLIKAKKLRRPTDFNEKQTKNANIVSSPPAKYRRTCRKQSAGSGSTEEADQLEVEIKNSENTLEKVEIAVDNENANKECKVVVERLHSSEIRSLTRSRSLEMSFSKMTNADMFSDNIPLSDWLNKETDHSQNAVPKKKSFNTVPKGNLNTTHTVISSEVTTKKLKNNEVVGNTSFNEEEIHFMIDDDLPVAHSSPVVCLSPLSEGEFRGFNMPSNKNVESENQGIQYNKNSVENEMYHLEKANLPGTHSSPDNDFNLQSVKNDFIEHSTNVIGQNTFTKENFDKALKVVEITNEGTENCAQRKTVTLDNEEKAEEVKIETNIEGSRTKVLRKRGNQTDVEINENPSEIVSSENKSENLQNIRSRTKVIKKANEDDCEVDQKSSVEGLRNGYGVCTKEEFQSESNIRSRTKVLQKKNGDISEEERSIRSRTKTVKKVPSPDDVNLQFLSPKFKEPLVVLNKGRILLSPKSPATTRGELVKKRVEDFEKITNGIKEIEEEKTGRVTRNATKNKALTSSQESLNSKQTRVPLPAYSVKNILTNGKGKHNKKKEDKENIIHNLVGSAKRVPPAERSRLTPIIVNNVRMTPASPSNSRTQDLNKFGNSATRQVPIEINSSTALLPKQAAEDADKKKKEEERKKRQAKEEDAKKKKEKTLKATAEETRRKREEKLHKVAAAREAAEKEKALLAAKAEKEKEEKMRQMAVEKERQKEEQLKKKLLMQQKTLEHEERRKLEEAARLAKLKEQEEEHKRIIAMKEREQELQKQQKAAELRLAEAEKIKHQGGKLGKVAAVNNAKMKLQQGMTPSAIANVQSYEITPAREDRPLLQPKTDNDYGIDDANSGDSSDEESHPKKMIPLWAQSKNREHMLVVNSLLPNTIWNLFMQSDPNPDINKIFAGNPIKKRLRTSSAVWKTPPRCTHFLHK